MKSIIKTGIACSLFAGIVLLPNLAAAGPIEVSLGFSFSQTHYSEESFTWTRKWGASLGYYLTELTEIEIAFQEIVDRNKIVGYEDTTFNDKIYSANWIQSLTKTFPIQPYVKAGLGQLNRDATGTYYFGSAPPSRVDSVTGIIGAGLKIYVTRNFGIRAEATAYLTGGSIRTWKDNTSTTIGVSGYF